MSNALNSLTSSISFKHCEEFETLPENIKPIIVLLLEDSFPKLELNEEEVPLGICTWLEKETENHKKEILCFATFSYDKIENLNYKGVIIHNVCTAPNYRRQGLMTQLLHEIKNYFKELYNEEKFVYLYVWEWNESALKGYLKDGFKKCGELREYCEEKEEMCKHLILMNKI
jgi:GNAT superfamily N-acetyltransferase